MNKKKILLALTVLSPLLLAGLLSSLMKEEELRKTANALRRESSLLEDTNAKLNDKINYFSLRSNIEREARIRLNLAKPGEHVVVFIAPSPSVSPNPSPSATPKHFWDWILRR